MESSNLFYKIECGILIHQLPKEFMGKAIKFIQRSIKYMSFEESGMRVYFTEKEICDEYIRKKSIHLDGILFNIYPTVTCLTVYGIHSSASKEEIETYFMNKGMNVLHLYHIANSDHSRIILNTPEVLANMELVPISMDADTDAIFPLEFYCRLCHSEGHKQYQCLSQNSTSSFTKNLAAGGSGNEGGGAGSSNTGNVKQENAGNPSCSGSHNSGGGRQSTGNQNSGKLAARKIADLSQSNLSPSSMLPNEENLMSTSSKNTSGFHNTGGGDQSTGSINSGNVSAREKGELPQTNPSPRSIALYEEYLMSTTYKMRREKLLGQARKLANRIHQARRSRLPMKSKSKNYYEDEYYNS